MRFHPAFLHFLAALALTLSLPGAALAADSGGQLTVFARVLKHARVQVMSQPQVLVITEADIRRGWVAGPAPVQVAVQSNSPDGYSIALTNHGPFVRATQVVGLGAVMHLQAETLARHRPMPGPGIKRDVVDLSFRFELTADAREGTYAWPIQVAVLAL